MKVIILGLDKIFMSRLLIRKTYDIFNHRFHGGGELYVFLISFFVQMSGLLISSFNNLIRGFICASKLYNSIIFF